MTLPASPSGNPVYGIMSQRHDDTIFYNLSILVNYILTGAQVTAWDNNSHCSNLAELKQPFFLKFPKGAFT